MRSKLVLLVMVGFFAMGARTAAVAAETLGANGNFNVYLGAKSLDDDDWGETDDQLAAGISFDGRKPAWPINLVGEGILSTDSHDSGPIDTTSSVLELAAGVRKYLDFSPQVAIFMGGGPALLFGSVIEDGVRLRGGSLENADRDDSGIGIGAWLGGGVVFRPGDRLNLGLNVRYSWGEVEIFDHDREAGGLLINALAGIRF